MKIYFDIDGIAWNDKPEDCIGEVDSEIWKNYGFAVYKRDWDIIDGEWVAIHTPEQIQAINDSSEEIKQLKKLLADTDYLAIKYAEGILSNEEYAPYKAQRKEYRQRINDLEQLAG